jgi:3-oxoacyl-[acyl-carrier-protein] synthase III
MSVRIKQIEYYLPEQIIRNADLAKEFPEWEAEKIEEKVGIRSRHIALKDETALDLAFMAAEKLLSQIDRNTVDFIILCTQSPDYFLPTSACILQDKLKLRKNIGAFDFNLGCSGYVYGLGIAKGLINSNIAQRILLLTSETYSKHIHQSDKGSRSIFGDGATATLIEKSDEEGIHEFVFGTDGSGMNNLIVKRGGMRYNQTDNYNHPDNCLYMNGPEIFNFTLDVIPDLVKKTLELNELKTEEINYFIFHQANKFMLDYLRKKLKVDPAIFYNNLLTTGNTVSSTIPIAIKDCLDNNLIKSKNKIMIAGFGVGYSWGATVITI